MDSPQFSDFRAALSGVPDPRRRRGRRDPWPALLTLIAAALASGQQGVRAIAQWVAEHAEEVRPLLALPPGRVPSPATLRRARRLVDVAALEARLARFVADLPPPPPADPAPAAPLPPPAWVGLAVDGQAGRGANRRGARVHLVRLVRHRDAGGLGQVAVDDESNEIPAARRLLARRKLAGRVTTGDAMLTQRALARQIRAQGGHDLMVVKDNHPTRLAAIERVLTDPPPLAATDGVASVATRDKGHGRLELRTLERRAALNDDLGWPDVGQVRRRTCQRIDVTTGGIGKEEVTDGVTSRPPTAATAAEVEAWWRGHWGSEHRVHRVRDATRGEDARQVRVGRAPPALAALGNGLLSLLRALGGTPIADALRPDGAFPQRAVRLLTSPPTRR